MDKKTARNGDFGEKTAENAVQNTDSDKKSAKNSEKSAKNGDFGAKIVSKSPKNADFSEKTPQNAEKTAKNGNFHEKIARMLAKADEKGGLASPKTEKSHKIVRKTADFAAKSTGPAPKTAEFAQKTAGSISRSSKSAQNPAKTAEIAPKTVKNRRNYRNSRGMARGRKAVSVIPNSANFAEKAGKTGKTGRSAGRFKVKLGKKGRSLKRYSVPAIIFYCLALLAWVFVVTWLAGRLVVLAMLCFWSAEEILRSDQLLAWFEIATYAVEILLVIVLPILVYKLWRWRRVEIKKCQICGKKIPSRAESCRFCGTKTDPNGAFCKRCGRNLSTGAEERCTRCGVAVYERGDDFCRQCGARLPAEREYCERCRRRLGCRLGAWLDRLFKGLAGDEAKTSRNLLGLSGWLKWTDLGLACVGFVVYIILSAVLMAVLANVPGFDATAEQVTGFSSYLLGWDLFLVFVALVLVAPIAEEVVFRGWLYGKMRTRLGAVLATLIVSAFFGFLHGQLNVGVAVFALSLVLCGLREITGTIYAGILLHIIKNLVAFCLVYMVFL